MDAFVVKAISDEIYPLINKSNVVKITEISEFSFILTFYSEKNGNHNLLISADNLLPRVHLTSKRMPSVKSKSRFVQNLKKYLEGAVITKIHSGKWERIIQISFLAKSKESKTYAVIIELIGMSSNIFLLDGKTGDIIDSMKKKSENISHRKDSKYKYILPPLQKKKSLDEIDSIIIKKIFFQNKKENLNLEHFRNTLVEKISGISPSFADVISSSIKDPSDLFNLLKRIKNSYLSSSFSPAIVFSDNHSPDHLLAYGELLDKPYKFKYFQRMNDAAEIYFSNKDNGFDLADKKIKLTRLLLSKIKRKEKTKNQIKTDIEKSKEYKDFKKRGDLIIVNLPKIPLKSSIFHAIEGNVKVAILLNPRFSATQNAELYYKKFKKYKRMRNISKKRFQMIKEEILYLKSIVLDIEESNSINDLYDLEKSSEFIKLNYSEKKEISKEKTEKLKPYLYFKCSEGCEIFVGNNSLGNEMILRNLGNKDDLWFHARDVPGSHVLLRVEKKYKKKYDESTLILQAASIAAFCSKSKQNNKVRVSYLPFQNLRRPKGSGFGKVIFSGHKTILVFPEIGEKILKSFSLKIERSNKL